MKGLAVLDPAGLHLLVIQQASRRLVAVESAKVWGRQLPVPANSCGKSDKWGNLSELPEILLPAGEMRTHSLPPGVGWNGHSVNKPSCSDLMVVALRDLLSRNRFHVSG